MLAIYGAIAEFLRGYQWLLWVLTVLAVGLFAGTLFVMDGEDDEFYTLGAVCVVLWSLSLIAFVRIFTLPVPYSAAGDGFFKRMKTSINRGLRWVLALLMTALLLAILGISLRALAILA